MSDTTETKSASPYVVKSTELPASCPPKGDAVIGLHPRVYLKFNDSGQSKCPYCGAKFVLQG
ncbi:MAG: zinc-finger domain-containing protein [Gammaproteobacteria bacterium]|nr:zinc-finger domain-containing protein [Gammaproteobacteria bacterium]